MLVRNKNRYKYKYDNPKEVGADRIVNAVAAYEIYKRSYDNNRFWNCYNILRYNCFWRLFRWLHNSGVKISSDALLERTKLQRVELEMPDNIICKNTITSIQAGLIYGYVGQVEYIVKKMKAEMTRNNKCEEPFVIATGGLGKLIAKNTKVIDELVRLNIRRIKNIV